MRCQALKNRFTAFKSVFICYSRLFSNFRLFNHVSNNESVGSRLFYIMIKSIPIRHVEVFERLGLFGGINSSDHYFRLCMIQVFRRRNIIENQLDAKRKYLPTRNSRNSELIDNGWINTSKLTNLTDDEIGGFREVAFNLKWYNSQVPMQSNGIPVRPTASHSYYSLKPDHPELVQIYKRILNSNGLKDLVNAYLGFESKLFSINTMLTLPSKHTHAVTDAHRDLDSEHFLALFIYWSNVTRDNGATFFIPGSHLNDTSSENTEGMHFEGSAGTSFLFDPYGFHSGNKLIKTPRLVTWFRFGKRPNNCHFNDKNYLHDDLFDSIWK